MQGVWWTHQRPQKSPTVESGTSNDTLAMIMSLVQTFSKCLKYNLETKREINHFTVMGEDLNLGLQEIPAKATVWIRCDSSVGGRGCAVRSAQTLLVILIPVLGKAWAVRSANWPPSQREQPHSRPALESLSKQRAALEADTQGTIFTNWLP